MRPYYFRAFLMSIFIAISMVFMSYMYVIHVRHLIPWVLTVLMFSIFTLFFVDSFYELFKGQNIDEINKYKRRIYYSDQYFTVDYPYLQQKEIIYWESVEAIFLSNRIPLDGEYHNFEYSIFLNFEPQVLKYEIQNWLNRSSIFPKPKRRGLPIITIKDDDN